MILLITCILGLIFGSFGSVIFFRLGDLPNRKVLKSFLIGRSECQYCHHTLHRKDLFPIVSFAVQRGKCRYCKGKLSRRYPAIELGSMLIFVLVPLIANHGSLAIPTQQLGIIVLLTFSLRLTFLIALYDFYRYELHSTATLLLFILSCWLNYQVSTPLLLRIQSIGLFFGIFLAIYFVSKLRIYLKYHKNSEGFGFGDVLFTGIIGSFFPVFFTNLESRDGAIILCLFVIISCIIGILIYALSFVKFFKQHLIKSQKKSDLPITKIVKTTPIPFIPAMAISFLLLLICRNYLLTLMKFYL